MAATLDRPLHAIGDAEGTALGAAALGLFALGRAPQLRDALAQLSPPAASEPPPMVARRDLVVTYDRLRASVPELIASLAPVAELLAPDAGRRAPGERATEPSR
jgi:gluconokinase